MQSCCLCGCVYILLPSPITFGLIAQFQPILTGGVEVPGVLLVLQAVWKSAGESQPTQVSPVSGAAAAAARVCVASESAKRDAGEQPVQMA